MSHNHIIYFSSMSAEEFLRANQDNIEPEILQHMHRICQEYEQRLHDEIQDKKHLHEEWQNASDTQKTLLGEWEDWSEELLVSVEKHITKAVMHMQRYSRSAYQASDPHLEYDSHA